jgi:hypothetical protein
LDTINKFEPGAGSRVCCGSVYRRAIKMLGTILLVILILMLLGAMPTWPHSRNWGYGPSGGLGLVALIIIILLLMGRI